MFWDPRLWFADCPDAERQIIRILHLVDTQKASRLSFASAVHMHHCRRNRKYIVFGPTLDSDADSERLRGRLGSVDAGA